MLLESSDLQSGMTLPEVRDGLAHIVPRSKKPPTLTVVSG